MLFQVAKDIRVINLIDAYNFNRHVFELCVFLKQQHFKGATGVNHKRIRRFRHIEILISGERRCKTGQGLWSGFRFRQCRKNVRQAPPVKSAVALLIDRLAPTICPPFEQVGHVAEQFIVFVAGCLDAEIVIFQDSLEALWLIQRKFTQSFDDVMSKFLFDTISNLVAHKVVTRRGGGDCGSIDHSPDKPGPRRQQIRRFTQKHSL